MITPTSSLPEAKEKKLSKASDEIGNVGKEQCQTTQSRATAEALTAVVERHCDPSTITDILEKFDSRHWVWKAMYSEGHQLAQRRMIIFWAVTNNHRHHVFKEAAKTFRWTAPTQESYWALGMKIAGTLISSRTAEDLAFMRLLKRQSMASPVRYPHGVTPVEMAELIAQLTEEQARVCAATTYALAARFADTAQLCAEDILPLTESGLLGVVFRFGKVCSRIGTFVVHLPIEAAVAKNLQLLAEKVKSGPLFDKSAITDTMRQALQAKGWKQPQIRRGALQEMAKQGAPLECLLQLSRHTTVKMLDHYLAKGLFKIDSAIQVAKYQPLIDPQRPAIRQQAHVSVDSLKPKVSVTRHSDSS